VQRQEKNAEVSSEYLEGRGHLVTLGVNERILSQEVLGKN
jgi:hypothetical protein